MSPLTLPRSEVTNMASSVEYAVGSIDERGYLKSFDRKGFTPQKCILELVANTLDAMDKVGRHLSLSKKLAFHVTEGFIYMMDNGIGMGRDAAKNMFSLHHENHHGDTSRGVSGIGAKPSLSILSEVKTVHLYTRMPEGEYLHIIVPWDMIHREGRYTGMISVCAMTDEEKAEFESQRETRQMMSSSGAHGTTIKFPYNEKLKRTLEDNFLPISGENEDTKPLDRIGIVFGRDEFECVYTHYEGDSFLLKKYNYLQGAQPEFYRGKSEEIIEMWVTPDKRQRFIWKNTNGEDYEINASGRGWKKEPETVTANTNNCKKLGEFTVAVGLRKNLTFFNHEQPVLPEGASPEKNVNPYHIEHLGKDCIDFLSQFKLVRNGQLIGLIPAPDVKVSSHRAGANMFMNLVMMQCEVRYNPVSNQDNPLDHAMNIQENKNQYDGSSVDKKFTRLLLAIKKKKATEIWEYFESTVKASLPVAPAPLEVESESEEEEEEESMNSDSVENLIVHMRDAAVIESAPAPVDSGRAGQPTTIFDFLSTVTNTAEAQRRNVSPENSVEDAEDADDYIIPVDSQQHVRGHELIQQLQRVLASIDASAQYTDENTIRIFSALMNY